MFAFLEFEFARDAKRFLETTINPDRYLTMEGRFAVIRPGVVCGSWRWIWWKQEWVRLVDAEQVANLVDSLVPPASSQGSSDSDGALVASVAAASSHADLQFS